MNSTPEITIDITSPEGATENDVLVSAVLNAMKPAIVCIVAEAVKQAVHIQRAEIERLRAKLAPIEAAARAYHAACEASRVVGGDARAASEACGRAWDALGDAVYDTIADEIDAEAPR